MLSIMNDAIEQNIHWLLIRAAIPAKHVFMKAGEVFGLTHMQLFTLCLIQKDKATPMYAITTMLACDASNVTGLVEKLVSSGFIERTESPSDRRIKLIRLSEKGRKTRELIMHQLAEAKVSTLSDMTDQEIRTLSRLLTKALASCSAAKHE